MKTAQSNFFQHLGKAHLEELVKEVKETVATGIQVQGNKNTFGAVDYWKLQRSRRTRVSRRFLVA